MKDKLLGLYGALAAMGGTSYSASPIVTSSNYTVSDGVLDSYEYLMREIQKLSWEKEESVGNIPGVVADAMYLLNQLYPRYTADWSNSPKDSQAKLDHYFHECIGLTFIGGVIETVLPDYTRSIVPHTITNEMIRKDWVDSTTQQITIPYEIFAAKSKMLMNWGNENYCIMVESNKYTGKVIPFCYDENFASADGSINFVFKQPKCLSLSKQSDADTNWSVVINRKIKSAGTISSYTNPSTIY